MKKEKIIDFSKILTSRILQLELLFYYDALHDVSWDRIQTDSSYLHALGELHSHFHSR